MDLSFAVQISGLTRVSVVGELDVATGPELRECLAEIHGDIELDCAGLSFVDASGLRVLLWANERCEAMGARLVLVTPSRQLLRLLQITNLERTLNTRLAETEVA